MANYWRAWTQGATTPIVFDDPGVLATWLNNQPQGTVIAVTEYDLIERQTVPYNITGGRPIPPKPANAGPTNPVAITHMYGPNGGPTA